MQFLPVCASLSIVGLFKIKVDFRFKDIFDDLILALPEWMLMAIPMQNMEIPKK